MRPGAWSTLGSPAAAAALARSGVARVVLDAQHGLWDESSVLAALAVLTGTAPPGVEVLVRVPREDPAWAGRVLDAGADGVVVPLVEDAAAAGRAARACRYPPRGGRSWGQLAPLWTGAVEDPARADARVRCVVMVESPGALERVEEIAAVPGVDEVFVGPYDLALSLGTTHAELLAATAPGDPLPRVVAACRAAGISAGAFGGAPEPARALAQMGFDEVVVVVDATALAEGAAASVAALAGSDRD
ncbi:HpcH/HpaI aldolase family protein [Kineococcus terrestris]|uniref:HpcH/HpaI aldolase family protein n=1 Tax=Kineococcus terrestris TaxID=2044856 RepID=UPI0034DB2066